MVETLAFSAYKIKFSFNFHHRVVETQIFNFHSSCYSTLTFTIGWLKLIIKICRICVSVDFNFHHRVVETSDFALGRIKYSALTFTIGWLKLKYDICFITVSHFNFHHRVVETKSVSPLTTRPENFNFHHRVVDKKQKSTQHQLRCCVLFYIFVGITSSCDSCGLNP